MSTDQRELVHQLQATLSKMEVALGTIGDAVVFVGEDTKVQWCNRAFEQLVKRTHSTITRSEFSELLPLMQAGEPLLPNAYPDVKLRNGGYEATEYELLQSDRSLVLQISGNYVQQSDRSCVLVIRDVTQTKSKATQTEEALKASEARLNAILSSALAAIKRLRFYANREWECEYVSAGSIQLWGYSPEELIANKNAYLSRIVPEDLEAIKKSAFDDIFASRTYEGEYRYNHPDGSLRWMSFSLTSVRNEASDCWIVTTISTDITDKKRAEIALAESEFKFRSIVENAGDVLCIVSLEGVVRYVSPNVVNLVGFTPAEMEGQSFEPFIYPDEVPRLREVFKQLATTGESISGLEYRAIHKDGHCIWQLSNLSSFRDIKGEWLIIGVVRDITERKQAEEALQASETRLNTILNSAVACIQRSRLYADGEWEFEYISAGSLQLWGYSPQELIADKKILLSHYVPEDLAAIYENGFEQIFLLGTCAGEYRYHHPDGRLRWFSFNTSCVRDEAADCWICTGINTDITERKQAEAALQESEAKFRAIYESIDVAVTLSDETGFVDINSAAERLFGYPRETIVGNRLDKVSPPFQPNGQDSLSLANQQIAIALKQGTHRFEWIHRRPDGTDYPTDVWFSWVQVGDRKLLHGIIQDLTQRKRAEAALAERARLAAFRGDVGSALTQSDTLPDILEACVQAAVKHLQATFARIWTFNPQDDVFELKASAGLYTRIDGAYSRVPRRKFLVDRKPEPYITNNLPGEPSISDHDWVQKEGWVAAANYPILLDQELLGMLVMFSRQTLSKSTLEALGFAATEIALGIKRKQAEEALQASEAKLNTILDSTLAAINRSRFYANGEWEFEYISAGSLELWGYSPQELIADKNLLLSHVVLEELTAIYENVFEQVYVEGSCEGEYRYHHPDGRWRWIYFSMTSVRDEAADCWMMTVFSMDISDRKLAEAELERRVRVESLLSSISRQFIDQDIETAMQFTLKAIANFIGVERSYIFEISQDEKQYSLTYEWCASGILPLSDIARRGQLTPFPWIEQQIFSRQIIAIPSIAALPPEAVAEREIFQHQSLKSILIAPMTHSGKVIGCLTLQAVHSSKTWTQDDINLLKLVGELIAIGCARHAAEKALVVAKEAAEGANRAKSTFLANMSHELRTPLNAILGFAQLMERDSTLTSRQRDSVGIINRSGEHLLNLINDVLEMSKIEAGRIVLNPEPINLHWLLQTLQEMFQIRAQAKRISLQFDLAPDLPQCVLTDEGKLRQVLINLLSNAIKFTETGGITLRARTGSEKWGVGSGEKASPTPHSPLPTAYCLHFEVEDTGQGIAPEEMDILFQPFVQTTSGIQARVGTGLGLTISRQFVRLMGGDIQFSSTVGKGSTFRFDIQVTLADTQAIKPTLALGRVFKLAPHQPSYRILIVDDRPENRDLITQLLDTVGFEVRTATNGYEAIQEWQQWHPHLIWMDMRMPVMDGYEATRQIRQKEAEGGRNGKTKGQGEFLPKAKNSTLKTSIPPTVIIALTASAFEEQRATILAAGCDDFVRKPFREQALFEKMAEYLGVLYVYDQDSTSQGTQELGNQRDSKTIKSDDLAPMPAEWIAQLHQAALEVDAEQIIQLIEQIPETYLALAEGLTSVVRRFGFDEILELIQGDGKL